MSLYLLGLTIFTGLAATQRVGTNTPEVHPQLPSQQCTLAGGCKNVTTSIVLDSQFRWLHNVNGTTSCNANGVFNSTYCSDAASCGQNCALEGADYASYGIATSGNSVQLNLFTNNGTNMASPRVYLLQNESSYAMFQLLNREFTYDVDVSQLPCGVNGALYFSEMNVTGNMNSDNVAGARYGTGYCDAQCPKNQFVAGEANINGSLGACCNEMDIWEANSAATALTPHPCEADGVLVCSGASCSSTCDPAGCDFNPYRLGAHNFYGANGTVDTNKPFTVITQFVTDTGADNGTLAAINRLYKQDGKIIASNSKVVNMTGVSSASNTTITDQFCKAEAQVFNEGSSYTFDERGGMQGIGAALGRGMVLAMSVWEDPSSGMQWLDGQTGDPSQPGNLRGPCSPTSGQAGQIQQQYPNTAVTFSNIKTGEIGSTY